MKIELAKKIIKRSLSEYHSDRFDRVIDEFRLIAKIERKNRYSFYNRDIHLVSLFDFEKDIILIVRDTLLYWEFKYNPDIFNYKICLSSVISDVISEERDEKLKKFEYE